MAQAVQLVTPKVANRILDQMAAFKKWVQSMASQETSDDLVPFVYVGFGKELERKEL